MRRFCWLLSQDYLWDETFKFRCLIEYFVNDKWLSKLFLRWNVTLLLRRTLILCDLFNEIFKTGNWGVTNPNFLNCLFWLVWSLLMYLILLKHHLYQIWLSFMNRLNIWKNVQERQFSENLFSQMNDVGLSMYAVYVINKMILNYFIEN